MPGPQFPSTAFFESWRIESQISKGALCKMALEFCMRGRGYQTARRELPYGSRGVNPGHRSSAKGMEFDHVMGS